MSEEELFSHIQPMDINRYLQQFMPELTAKVFRTYNSSKVFEKELNKIENKVKDIQDPVQRKKKILYLYDLANIQVALLCNHQKKPSKSHKGQLESIKQKIKSIKSKTKKSDKDKQRLQELKDKFNLKKELKSLSLLTSRQNYIDPRITVSFLKKMEIPIESVFTSTILRKFKWAEDTTPLWKF